MPEVDVLQSFKHMVVKQQNAHMRQYKTPLHGHFQLFPRTFALGTATKSWSSCFTQLCGYTDSLEPTPAEFQPNKFDMERSAGQPWAYLLKPLHDGEVVVQTRGKELFLAAGYHGIRLNLGLEATIMCMRPDDFQDITSADVPGPNPNKAKAQKLCSFLIDDRFIVEGSHKTSKARQITIFAALVCDNIVFAIVDLARLVVMEVVSLDRHWQQSDAEPGSQFWDLMWSNNHGPDWISEPDAATQALLEWRQRILKEPLGAAAQAPILRVICDSQDIFNGFGRHTASDFLHLQGLWPAMPPLLICKDEDLFQSFLRGVSSYMAQWVSPDYLSRVAGVPALDNPLQFNYKSDRNYMATYVLVYRKTSVSVPATLYNKLLQSGMFDPTHMIGISFQYPYPEAKLSPSDFAQGQFKICPVWTYQQGTFKIYTIIRACPREEWWFQVEIGPVLANDARLAGYKTTLGPAQFRNQLDNRLDPKAHGKPGRRPKVSREAPATGFFSLHHRSEAVDLGDRPKPRR
ncbi:hypothetical protein B0H21DRAFT_695410 [Amylocystis lapponica]|nr:hypothetical protein B0H21DRAFT_695410 [Amylocystis lapponica]